MDATSIRAQLRAYAALEGRTDIVSDTQLDEFVVTAVERMIAQSQYWVQRKQAVFGAYKPGTTVQLPDDFITEHQVFVITQGDGSTDDYSVPITKIDGGKAAWLRRTNGPPSGSAFVAPTIDDLFYYVYPSLGGTSFLKVVPTSGQSIGNLAVEYTAKQLVDNLTGTDLVKWMVARYSRTVLFGALEVLHIYLHDYDAAVAANRVWTELLSGSIKRDAQGKFGGQPKQQGL